MVAEGKHSLPRNIIFTTIVVSLSSLTTKYCFLQL